MLTVKEIKNNTNTECNSCGKKRKRYFEIRYGIRIPDFPWQPYSTLPLCASCVRKLGNSIEKKLTVSTQRKGAKQDYRDKAVGIGYLYDWYQTSVTDDPPVWTDEHIEELHRDFYCIPKTEEEVKQDE